jgi:type IV pilus assembly protein PilQ
MRRGSKRTRAAWILAAVLAASVGLSAPTLAGRFVVPYDDRPPLLADEDVPPGAQTADRLAGVELLTADEAGRTDLAIHANGALPYEVFQLTGPDRLVLDLPGVQAGDIPGLEVGTDGLVRVRVAQFREAPDTMARVVLDFTEPHTWDVSRQDDALRVSVAPERLAGSAVTADRRPVAAAEPQSQDSQTDQATEPVEPVAVAESAEADDVIAEVVAASTESAEPAAYAAVVESKPAEPAMPAVASLDDQGAEADPVLVARNAQPAEAESWSEPDIAQVIEEAAALEEQQTFDEPENVTYLSESVTASTVTPLPSTETKTIEDVRRAYTGRPITTNLVDADIKQVFSLFHEISGLNFVLDPAVKGSVTIVVDNVPWDQALDLILKNNGLDMVMEGNVIRIAPVAKLAAEANARKALFEAKELEAPPVTITRTLSYAKAKDVENIIRDAIVSERGRVIVDERTNTLIIRDIPTRVEATDKLLSTLDAETPQVMIEARIVEVSRDFVKDLGIQWGMSAIADPSLGTQTSLDFPHRARMDYDLNLPRNPNANALGFSFGNVLDSFTLDITIDALETEGYARRLSSPKIATQNNEPAEIEQGVRIPVVSTTATEIDVRFVSASLRLRVTPQITAEGTIILDVEVENNSPDFVNTVGEVPAINTQRAQTKVLIGDNGTTVIGGIFTVNEGRSETGVPFFRNIPGLGWLFRSENIQTRNRELLIFITPRIIKAT